jgi:hypothetical protein
MRGPALLRDFKEPYESAAGARIDQGHESLASKVLFYEPEAAGKGVGHSIV